MSIVDTVKTIKKVQVQDVVMIKIGKFVYCYGKDACIISYIFKYIIKMLQDNIYVCAFPKDKLNKIMATLENKKINYIVLDRRNNYRTDEENLSNGNLNRYNEYLEKAVKYVKLKNQVDSIYEFLIENIEKSETEEMIRSIKKVINERRKI